MSDFAVSLDWSRATADFSPKTYDRTHTLRMSGGFTYQGSAAPDFNGKAELANPEETLLAALASCHMLTFLAIAANSKLVVDSYEDTAVAKLEKNEKGKLCIKNVLLQPKVSFSGAKTPNAEELMHLHEKAHANCIIANSVAATVLVQPKP